MLSSTRVSPRVLSRAAKFAPLVHQRLYQGGLQDKDRIFTNLYNDTSPFLKDAMKRVCPPPPPLASVSYDDAEVYRHISPMC